MATDDSLKEILGYDPETGERTEVKGELKPQEREGLSIPDDVKEAFAKKYENDKNIKIDPKKLLTIENVDMRALRRTYYAWTPSKDGSPKFLTVAWADFLRKNDNFEVKFLSIEGEPSGEATSQEFTDLSFREGKIESLLLNFSGRQISISFDQSGTLTSVTPIYDSDQKLRQEKKLFEDNNDVKSLIDKGLMKISIGDIRYELEAQSDLVRIKRFQNEDLKDELTIPQKIDEEEIMEKLFNPLTLKDPVNAPAELDDSWRFTNLMEAMGVRWERH